MAYLQLSRIYQELSNLKAQVKKVLDDKRGLLNQGFTKDDANRQAREDLLSEFWEGYGDVKRWSDGDFKSCVNLALADARRTNENLKAKVEKHVLGDVVRQEMEEELKQARDQKKEIKVEKAGNLHEQKQVIERLPLAVQGHAKRECACRPCVLGDPASALKLLSAPSPSRLSLDYWRAPDHQRTIWRWLRLATPQGVTASVSSSLKTLFMLRLENAAIIEALPALTDLIDQMEVKLEDDRRAVLQMKISQDVKGVDRKAWLDTALGMSSQALVQGLNQLNPGMAREYAVLLGQANGLERMTKALQRQCESLKQLEEELEQPMQKMRLRGHQHSSTMKNVDLEKIQEQVASALSQMETWNESASSALQLLDRLDNALDTPSQTRFFQKGLQSSGSSMDIGSLMLAWILLEDHFNPLVAAYMTETEPALALGMSALMGSVNDQQWSDWSAGNGPGATMSPVDPMPSVNVESTSPWIGGDQHAADMGSLAAMDLRSTDVTVPSLDLGDQVNFNGDLSLDLPDLQVPDLDISMPDLQMPDMDISIDTSSFGGSSGGFNW